MARYEPGEAIYVVAERFVDVALRRDDSLFTPGAAIWSLPWLEELDRRYVQNPDVGAGSFEQKLRIQLGGASPQAYQLMAEALYMNYLPEGWKASAATKRAAVQEVVSWSPSPVAVPPDMIAVLGDRVGSGGVGFNLYKWASLAWLITFFRKFKQETSQQRERLLSDPWEFRDYVAAIPTEGGGAYGRESLLHLVFSDSFERIFSGSEKWRLTQKLSSLVDDPAADVDRQLGSIRRHLGARFGPNFDFYDTDGARALWRPFDDPWNGFIYWASRFHERPDFDPEERDYKFEIVRKLTAVREAVKAGGDWFPLLKRAFGSPNNLTPWQMHDKFLSWCQADPTAARELLKNLWEGPGEALVRLAAFERDLPTGAVSGMGGRTCLGSFLLMAVDPTVYPPYRVSAFQTAYKLARFEPGPQHDEAAMYRAGLKFLQEFRDRAASRGLVLRDLLDAQSAVWCVTNWEAPADWPPEDKIGFERYRAGLPEAAEDGEEEEQPVAVPEPEVPATDPLVGLADELLIKLDELEEIRGLLKSRRQVIFYGPPGTGKTYIARKLARALAGDGGRVVIVQFHPSYAYEDFVEGFRPRLDVDTPSFELVPGPLKKLAKRAAADPGHDYYLVIDELNRGNVAKVFGELYYLLEYRDDPIALQYSAEPFQLPANLCLIGTMNTADKSIALLDAALRRRFSFVPFFPDRPPIEGLLRRWLQRNRPDMSWVADVVDLANRKLDDRHCAIGPSFFMRTGLNEPELAQIWRREIEPYLEDYFFDSPHRLEEFSLPTLRKEMTAMAVAQESTTEAVATPEEATDGQADPSGV